MSEFSDSTWRAGVLDMFTSNMPKVNEYGVEELVQNFHSPSPSPNALRPTAPTAPYVGGGFASSGPSGFYAPAGGASSPIPWTMIAAGAGALVVGALVIRKLKKKKR